MTPPPGTPSDWVSGERVFAPPRGTVDVDWLVPAVLELVPDAAATDARAALSAAWARRRLAAGAPDGSAGPTAPPAAPLRGEDDGRGGDVDTLDAAAERVLAEALLTFGG